MVTALWHVYYVGKSKNLNSRWQSHHRHKQWLCLSPFGRIHYNTVPAKWLTLRENQAIAHFKAMGEADWNYSSSQPSFASRLLLKLKMTGFVLLFGSFFLIILNALFNTFYL